LVRAPVQGIAALAGLELLELLRQLQALGLGEPGDALENHLLFAEARVS
jgi:hypothetical protein